VDGERHRRDGRNEPGTVDIRVAVECIGAETVVTGAGVARRPRRISGGKTSSMAGFLSPTERETVEGVGVGCEGRAGLGVGDELSTSNPNDDTCRTDAGEPERDGDDTTLIGTEPCTQRPQKSPARSPYLPHHQRSIKVLRRHSRPDRPEPVVDLGLVGSLLLRVHLAAGGFCDLSLWRFQVRTDLAGRREHIMWSKVLVFEAAVRASPNLLFEILWEGRVAFLDRLNSELSTFNMFISCRNNLDMS